jgi:hypothetical protein
MQPLTDAPRNTVTAAQVIQLLQGEEAVTVTGGLEIVDLTLAVIEDISNDLAGGKVERNSYADMHGTANFQISRVLDWGGDLLRPYITMSGGGITCRWNLGVYHPSVPAWSLVSSPATYDVDGYDILLRLHQPVGDAFSINTGEAYLDKVENILLGRGYSKYLIDPAKAATVAPDNRTWAFDEATTWLTIVNDLLGTIGYAGIWSDWNGVLRCEPYVRPIDRAVEWTYTDDPDTTMLSTNRTVTHDFFETPNRWVVYRTNMPDGVTPTEGNGVYIYTNQASGETSVTARRGLVITKTLGVDAADQASLVAQAQSTIDADMSIPTVFDVETFLNPGHWHFDRLLLSDTSSLPYANVVCTQWSLPLPPDSGDMTQQWRVLV